MGWGLAGTRPGRLTADGAGLGTTGEVEGPLRAGAEGGWAARCGTSRSKAPARQATTALPATRMKATATVSEGSPNRPPAAWRGRCRGGRSGRGMELARMVAGDADAG